MSLIPPSLWRDSLRGCVDGLRNGHHLDLCKPVVCFDLIQIPRLEQRFGHLFQQRAVCGEDRERLRFGLLNMGANARMDRAPVGPSGLGVAEGR